MSEKEIFSYIEQVLTKNYIEDRIKENEIFGIAAKEIAEHFNQYRSNISAILNKSVKDQKLIKIESRPVLFLPIKILKGVFNVEPTKDIYSVEEFKQEFYNMKSNTNEPFELLVGYDGSQITQVQQAQSAILYPPNGLHTLITGESGTGKTLFARTMYSYGKTTKKKEEDEYPFVEFNCADYYHNPQLLLSQLFGHIRGAFTGATQETVGLVEKANGGILFLDEIHRLPPEGQELLFYLMDTGQYRKLGEANSIRKASVLIIGATTEDPNDVLLKTFKRRIPLSIQLPAYRERSLKERLEIIERLFIKEAIVTQRTYIIESDIVKALATFDFPGNIGQLASEIKILCARSFLENQSQESYEINIPYDFLANNIKKSYEKKSKSNDDFRKELAKYNFDMIISPSNSIQYQEDKILDEKSYANLIKEINIYSKQGLSSKQLAEKMNATVTDYYNDVLDRMYFKGVNKEEIYKIVDQEIVDFSIEIMKEIHKDLNVNITQQHILVLAFHLKFLIDRVKNKKQVTTSIEKETADETLVDNIIDRIEQEFKIQLPSDERNFFQLLLKNMANENISTRPELYILAHGNTATSLADVCNRLLNTNYVNAIDAPLSQDIERSYEQFLSEVKKSQPKNGVMILADMGSLLNFGKRMSEETGIASHTIPNVTTALALDLAHIMLNRNEHVDLIYNEYLIKNQSVPASEKSKKEPAILSACSSGKGTSVAFQSTIEDILKQNELDFISVFSINNADLQNKADSYQEILNNYNIIAVVGNVHINTDVPFFHISSIVSKEKESQFIEFIKNSNTGYPSENVNHEHSDYDDVIHFLEKHVMYVNPVAAVKTSSKFVDSLFKEFKPSEKKSNSLRMSLIIHLGFMIERIIVDRRIQYEDKQIFIKDNLESFNIIRNLISIIENAFEIEIHDDEICYIIVTLEAKEMQE